jgi:hypothetical protein
MEREKIERLPTPASRAFITELGSCAASRPRKKLLADESGAVSEWHRAVPRQTAGNKRALPAAGKPVELNIQIAGHLSSSLSMLRQSKPLPSLDTAF